MITKLRRLMQIKINVAVGFMNMNNMNLQNLFKLTSDLILLGDGSSSSPQWDLKQRF